MEVCVCSLWPCGFLPSYLVSLFLPKAYVVGHVPPSVPWDAFNSGRWPWVILPEDEWMNYGIDKVNPNGIAKAPTAVVKIFSNNTMRFINDTYGIVIHMEPMCMQFWNLVLDTFENVCFTFCVSMCVNFAHQGQQEWTLWETVFWCLNHRWRWDLHQLYQQQAPWESPWHSDVRTFFHLSHSPRQPFSKKKSAVW